jgi:signal transduction histidine kinase
VARRLSWRSTSTRLIVLYGLLFVVWGTALIAFINWQTHRYLVTVVDQILEQRMSYLLSVDRNELPRAMQAARKLDLTSSVQLGIFTPDGQLVSGNVARMPESLPVDAQVHDIYDVVAAPDGSQFEHARAIATRIPSGEVLVLVRNSQVIDRVGNIIGRSLLWGLSLTLVPGVIGGLLLARGPRKRIEQIRQATDPIIRGDLGRRLPVSGRGDELDMLAGIVNRMLGEIERLIGEVKGVCDSIAHDLRTPLTRLRAQLHRLKQQTAEEDPRSASLEQCITDTDALLNRFRALLRISELEDLHRRAGFAPMDVSTTLRQAYELYMPLAEDKGTRLTLDIVEPMPATADAGLLFEAISNLVGNALKFTPPGGNVRLYARNQPPGPVIEVIDSGPGIPPAERTAVLQRFYRSECGRADTKGFGLGLSIVAAIVRLHDFQLEIAAASGRGARVILRCWPAAVAATALAQT